MDAVMRRSADKIGGWRLRLIRPTLGGLRAEL